MQNNVEGYKFIFDLISEVAAAISRVLSKHSSTLFNGDSCNQFIDMSEDHENNDDSLDE